jgi:hypothetical protein
MIDFEVVGFGLSKIYQISTRLSSFAIVLAFWYNYFGSLAGENQ